jgi:hypothetical protein
MPNRILGAACLAVVVVQAVIPTVPALAEIFRASPLDAIDWLLVLAVGFGPAVVADLVRRVRNIVWVA